MSRDRAYSWADLKRPERSERPIKNFLKKNAFYVLTSEKYGVIYPAGKNNKKKYNHYVCYIRTDDSDTN